jgi:outer membrane autotransporter protein
VNEGEIQLRAGGFYTYSRFSLARSVAFPGFSDQDNSAYHAGQLQAFGEAGWRIRFAPSALQGRDNWVEPFVGISALQLKTGSFVETGGAAALVGAATTYGLGATTLGVRAEASPFAETPLIARATIGWRHSYGNVAPSAVLSFASAAEQSFAISGAPLARDAFLGEFGLDWRLSSAINVGLSYSGQLYGKGYDNALKGLLAVSF